MKRAVKAFTSAKPLYLGVGAVGIGTVGIGMYTGYLPNPFTNTVQGAAPSYFMSKPRISSPFVKALSKAVEGEDYGEVEMKYFWDESRGYPDGSDSTITRSKTISNPFTERWWWNQISKCSRDNVVGMTILKSGDVSVSCSCGCTDYYKFSAVVRGSQLPAITASLTPEQLGKSDKSKKIT